MKVTIYLFSILIAANICGMQGKKEELIAAVAIPKQQLTLIDLDRIEEEGYRKLSENQKWELFRDQRELVRKYAGAISNLQKTTVELAHLTEIITMRPIVENTMAQLQEKDKEKN